MHKTKFNEWSKLKRLKQNQELKRWTDTQLNLIDPLQSTETLR